LLFSEKWAADADGNAEWCYGSVTHVYVKRGGQAQTYRVKYDESTSMKAEDAHLELIADEVDSDDQDESDKRNGRKQL
jgi:hypothetical protein